MIYDDNKWWIHATDIDNGDDDDKQIATRLVESEMMEVLMAVSKLDDPQRKEASRIAEKTLEKAEEWGLVQHVDGAKWWRQLWGMVPISLFLYVI